MIVQYDGRLGAGNDSDNSLLAVSFPELRTVFVLQTKLHQCLNRSVRFTEYRRELPPSLAEAGGPLEAESRQRTPQTAASLGAGREQENLNRDGIGSLQIPRRVWKTSIPHPWHRDIFSTGHQPAQFERSRLYERQQRPHLRPTVYGAVLVHALSRSCRGITNLLAHKLQQPQHKSTLQIT